MKFVLETVCELDVLQALPGFEHADSATVADLLDEARRFMSEVIAPLNRVGDQQGSRLVDGRVVTPDGFQEAYRQYVEAGWAGAHSPAEYGGGGLPYAVGIGLQEMATAASLAFSLCPLLTHGGIDALLEHGDEIQRGVYLENMVTGRWTGTMNMTEPQAGSDVGALTTKAFQDDEGRWRIRGTKIFITWGDHDMTENIIHLVLARTPGAPPGTKGISLFLVPKYLVDEEGRPGEANDIEVVSLEHKLGIHASPTCVMSYGENEGAIGYLIGEENQGMRAMFTMMNSARLGVGLEGLAVADRAYQQAVAFAQERRQGRAVGAPTTESALIIEHPDVRRMLMTIKAYNEAMRALMYYAASRIDLAEHHRDPEVRTACQETVDLLTPVAKAWSTDLGCELTSIALQVFGGMGYVEETGIAQLYRDVRITPIYEGTNGIQAIDLVGRKLPMRDGGVMTDLLREVEATAAALGEGSPELATIGLRLQEAIAALGRATSWLLSRADAPNDVLAGATPYLRMVGTVLGGWLLGRQAAAAADKLAAGDMDEDFLRAKIATAGFYAGQLLPQAAGLEGAVTGGSDPLFAIEPKYLAG